MSPTKIIHFERRISDDIGKTLDMVKDFEALGVSAIAVHGRTRHQCSFDPVNKGSRRK